MKAQGSGRTARKVSFGAVMKYHADALRGMRRQFLAMRAGLEKVGDADFAKIESSVFGRGGDGEVFGRVEGVRGVTGMALVAAREHVLRMVRLSARFLGSGGEEAGGNGSAVAGRGRTLGGLFGAVYGEGDRVKLYQTALTSLEMLERIVLRGGGKFEGGKAEKMAMLLLETEAIEGGAAGRFQVKPWKFDVVRGVQVDLGPRLMEAIFSTALVSVSALFKTISSQRRGTRDAEEK